MLVCTSQKQQRIDVDLSLPAAGPRPAIPSPPTPHHLTAAVCDAPVGVLAIQAGIKKVLSGQRESGIGCAQGVLVRWAQQLRSVLIARCGSGVSGLCQGAAATSQEWNLKRSQVSGGKAKIVGVTF